MRKFLLVSTFLLNFLYSMDYFADFYVGWRGVNQEFTHNSQLSVQQMGIGIGGRFFIPINEMVYIGGEAGFSHIETHWDISGNITHAQFLLKVRPNKHYDVFGGIGIAGRGTPTDANGTTVPAVFGMNWNIGAAYTVGQENWRFEAVLYQFNFQGRIKNLNEEINSLGVGIHVGKTFVL